MLTRDLGGARQVASLDVAVSGPQHHGALHPVQGDGAIVVQHLQASADVGHVHVSVGGLEHYVPL